MKSRHNHIYSFRITTNDHRRRRWKKKNKQTKRKWTNDNRAKTTERTELTKSKCKTWIGYRPFGDSKRFTCHPVRTSKSNIIEFVPIHVLSACQSYSLYFHYDIRDMKKFLTPKFMYMMPNVLWSSCCRCCCCWWREHGISFILHIYIRTHTHASGLQPGRECERERARDWVSTRLGKNVCIALYLRSTIFGHTNACVAAVYEFVCIDFVITHSRSQYAAERIILDLPPSPPGHNVVDDTRCVCACTTHVDMCFTDSFAPRARTLQSGTPTGTLFVWPCAHWVLETNDIFVNWEFYLIFLLRCCHHTTSCN